MKRRLFGVFFGMVLSVLLAFPGLAANGLPRVVDWGDLLSDGDEADLAATLDEISERQQVDIVVVTVDSLEGQSAMAYADDFYDYNEYGFGEERDGILFLISMGDRAWHISTSGYGITAVTDAGLEYMSEAFVDDLSGGDYLAAFTTFAEMCDDYITQARLGEPYDVDHLPQEPFDPLWTFIISLGIGFLAALIVTGIMKGELKTVGSQARADDYVKRGSMNLTKTNDLYLYSHIDRRERKEEEPRDSGGSNTHTSSSGRTHGGGGGTF